MNSSVILPSGNDRVANPDNPVYRPYYFFPYRQYMPFGQRIINAVFKEILKLGYYMFAELPRGNYPKIISFKIIPPLSELKKRSSLILENIL
jgi:hypothetical protein